MNLSNHLLLAPGEIIRETYEVDRFIGSGAFAEVYRVKHKFLGLQALKVLRPESIKNVDISSFISEATILSHLTHPNIVRVFDANTFIKQSKELAFISMEYVSGESLYQLLRRSIRPKIPLALSIQRDICSGLSLAHRQAPPVVHRDVKPQNIMLSYDSSPPTAKVSDFGLAKVVDPKSRLVDSAGTMIYFAPEDFLGYHTPASDVFSAGIILYQMVAGVPPWSYEFCGTESDSQQMEKIIEQGRKKKLERPSLYNDLCDKSLDEIILRSIAEKPADRYNDATEFLNAVTGYQDRNN
jgi:serine/threonine-protein kinase